MNVHKELPAQQVLGRAMVQFDIRSKLIAGIMLCFSAYALLFIVRTSFVINGERYFVLFDDAMISMRFAKNLAEGHGLVWNAGGERVEGYTNPLWVLYMSLVHLLPVSASKTSLFIQLSALVFLLANLFVVSKIAQAVAPTSAFAAVSAVLLTAFYYPLNNWALQGMEVSALVLLVSVVLYRSIVSIQSGIFDKYIYIILAIGTLIRIDTVVIYLATLIVLALFDRTNRRRQLLFGATLLIGIMLLQTALRWLYYGDLLPNTYYLKMTGFPTLLRISRGSYVAWSFVLQMNWVLIAAPLLFAFISRSRALIVLAIVFLGQVAYSIYVGGDAWEQYGGSNRFISIVMPLYFVLFAHTLDVVRVSARAALFRRIGKARGVNLVAAGLIVLSLLNFDAMRGAASLADLVLINRPLYIKENEMQVRIALHLRQFTSQSATIAVVGAGTLPYFAERFSIDLLGKNDRKIAHQPMRFVSDFSPYIGFYPGHMKWNYAYSIGELRPDVVTYLWAHPEEARPFLDAQYTTTTTDVTGSILYLRRDSASIDWERVKPKNALPQQ